MSALSAGASLPPLGAALRTSVRSGLCNELATVQALSEPAVVLVLRAGKRG